MPRGGIGKKNNNIETPSRSFTFAIFRVAFDSRSSFFAPKLQGNACYAGYHGPREQCRSVPRGGVKEKKMIGRRPRERCVSFPLFGRKNELQGRKEHSAKGDRERAE